MSFGDFLKGVGSTITENLGNVIQAGAENLFTGQAAKAKAEAITAQAELEAYKNLTASQIKSTQQPTYQLLGGVLPTQKQTDMKIIDVIKKYWWIAAVLVAGYFILGALKKKSKVRRKRRRRAKSNPTTRRPGSGSRTVKSKTRRFKGRSYPFATKEDRRRYMEKVRNSRK